MLPLNNFQMPHSLGEFGAVRKHDIHTGIDLYTLPGSEVYAIEAGEVIVWGHFTGPQCNTPWWNNTDFVVVKGNSGYILYGEIEVMAKVGTVVEGQLLGRVVQVLKKDKGLPTSMLHLELHDCFEDHVLWELGKEKPKHLRDPTVLLKKVM